MSRVPPLIKLLFHHDLVLDAAGPANDLLAAFAAPQATWSRLWLSATHAGAGQLALSSLAAAGPVLQAVDSVFPGLTVATVLASADAFVLSPGAPVRIVPGGTGLPLVDLVRDSGPSDVVIRRSFGRTGFDLETGSRANIHSRLFNVLAPLAAHGFEMWSINGKRVSDTRQLYLETTGSARLPHGFERVAFDYRL